jgi:hypothetical protein
VRAIFQKNKKYKLIYLCFARTQQNNQTLQTTQSMVGTEEGMVVVEVMEEAMVVVDMEGMVVEDMEGMVVEEVMVVEDMEGMVVDMEGMVVVEVMEEDIYGGGGRGGGGQ